MDQDERLALAVRAQVALALAYELADLGEEVTRPEEGSAAPELREVDPQAIQLDGS